MSLLCRVAGLSIRDRGRSLDIPEELRVELLFLCVERSQLRWFGHLVKMPPVRHPDGPGADPGHDGAIISPGWLGNNLVSPLFLVFMLS